MILRFVCFCSFLSLLISCAADFSSDKIVEQTVFDWQGHRGARGLMPENTIFSFLKALEYPVTTLELDLVITKDQQVILSHEPWMSSSICAKADGTFISKEEAKDLNMYAMTYNEIQSFDCGSRGNERFPEQERIPTTKAKFADIVQAIEEYVNEQALPKPNYNIEIKSREKWDNVYTPPPSQFAKLVLTQIEALGIEKRTCVQSFDVRSLQVVRAMNPDMTLAFLVENEDGIDENLEKLGFTPSIYSCLYTLLSKEVVTKLHEKGMQVIPWTVNEVGCMEELIAMGVDGIITDYPNKIAAVGK